MGNVSNCIAERGMIVAVNFGHWHGPLVRGCALSSRTGYQLLHAAGFSTAGDEHDGSGFICRIGDGAFHHGVQYPTSAQAACVNTPSASAYWSYWIALPGHDTWTYSALGAQTQVPARGEVQLWQFGATNLGGGDGGSAVPRIKPDALRAPGLTAGLLDAGPTSARPASSSAVPFVLGVCLVLALLAGAGWRTWHRSRSA